MKRIALALAASSMLVTAAPALADPPSWAPAHGKRAKERASIYNERGQYIEPRRITRSSYVWRGDDGRYYCKRDNGTTGLLIGAGVGALAGHELAGRGDKTLGAVLGGVIGGVLGKAIDSGDIKCR